MTRVDAQIIVFHLKAAANYLSTVESDLQKAGNTKTREVHRLRVKTNGLIRYFEKYTKPNRTHGSGRKSGGQ